MWLPSTRSVYAAHAYRTKLRSIRPSSRLNSLLRLGPPYHTPLSSLHSTVATHAYASEQPVKVMERTLATWPQLRHDRYDAEMKDSKSGDDVSTPGNPSKRGTQRRMTKQCTTDEQNEQGLRWLARSLMGVYKGFGQTEDEALQQLLQLKVMCYSIHNGTTRKFLVEGRGPTKPLSRPHLIDALKLELNPGCLGTTVQKQFSRTRERMTPEEADRGMRWLAEGLAGAFVDMGGTTEEAMEILKERGVACTCISERETKHYFSIFGVPGRFVGRPAVVKALNLKVLDRAKAARTVGGSVASTFDVNEEENDKALEWLAGYILAGLDTVLGRSVEEVVTELKQRNVRCVRIEKRATNPRRFFKVGDDPNIYQGLNSTLQGLGLIEL